jgi:hypothetical protein
VNCQRIHYDPPGGGSASGSLSFPGTIVGVIYSSEGLYATDDLFANSGAVYGTPCVSARGFEGGDQNVAQFEDDNTLAISLSASSPGDEGRILTTAGGSGASSYGMNREIMNTHPSMSQIMLAEYRSTVINVAPGPLQSAFANMVAPRHFGRANTVRVDGSVRAYTPAELDPTSAHAFRTLWLGGPAPIDDPTSAGSGLAK